MSPGQLWRLRRLPVCASTERELDRWLRQLGPEPNLRCSGLAVVARRQRYGRGQQGRSWFSPAGGLWLSAAFDWPAQVEGQAAPLTLAVAVGLALQLEDLGLTPQIKWPNDLYLGGRKLAGILPRLRLVGGRVRWAQVGLGVNGLNRVPVGAISVAEALQGLRHRQGHGRQSRAHPLASPRALLPLALESLHWARRHANQAEQVQRLVEQRLLRPADGWPHQNRRWQLDGVAADGGLRLSLAGQHTVLRRLELSPADRV